MTLALILTVWTIASLATGLTIGAFIDAGMHPRRGEGEEQGSSDVHAELNGGLLPARIINLNHNEGI